MAEKRAVMSQCAPPVLQSSHGERSGKGCMEGKGRESEKARREVRKEGSGREMRDGGREPRELRQSVCCVLCQRFTQALAIYS